MSDKNKNMKSLLNGFLRYQRGEMTGKERNSFERELQKYPFAEEAAEGFASISPDESSKDLAYLQKQIKSRTVRRQRFIYYRIAASVAALMVISTIFIIVERIKPSKQLAETSGRTEAIEITIDQPLTEHTQKIEPFERFAMISEKKAEKSGAQQIRSETGKGAVPVENVKIPVLQIVDSVPEIKVKPVEEYVRDEKIAAPVAVFARAKADSQKQISLDTSVLALNEVVVVGYGTRRAEYDNEVIPSGYAAPQPVNGKSEFDKYIQENLQRPDTTTAGQRVVVIVSFLVRTDGSIDSIRIVRSPGKPFSNEAIRLIKSGPSWKPAEENGKMIDDEVRVRIVFR